MSKIIDDLSKRYTTKKFDSSKKVSSQDIEVIKKALQLTPSSINSQPWKFIIIESDNGKDRFNETFKYKFQFNQPHVYDSSHIILLCHNPEYKKRDYNRVIDKLIADNRLKEEEREQALGAFFFAELNTDEFGDTTKWTKSQLYIALGNLLHTLARMGIDSTTMEGIDTEQVEKIFSKELDGYKCDVALAIGYHHGEEDYNRNLPKSRLDIEDIIQVI